MKFYSFSFFWELIPTHPYLYEQEVTDALEGATRPTVSEAELRANLIRAVAARSEWHAKLNGKHLTQREHDEGQRYQSLYQRWYS